MKRRQFLQATAAGSLAGAASAAASAQPMVPASHPAAEASARAAHDAGFEWLEATADDLARAMKEGRTTAAALVEAYLARIAAIDAAGPTLRSVIELNPDAQAIAARLDAERAAGRVRGPLHGVPVLVKDNIATVDRMSTSAGSPALAGIAPPRDAACIARLRAAGAVILGKANLSEWANFRGRHSTSGWSTRGGQTRNPYALDRTPSGSSSGTGSAIAANLCALGVGTETDGSITSPSSVSALVGVKPTVGLVSRDGIIPIAPTQDTAGPMCRTVADAALLLAAMAGVDERDPATKAQAGRLDPKALLSLAPDALKGARIGVAVNLLDDHAIATVALFERALDALKDAGATLVRAPLPNAGKVGERELTVLAYEMCEALPRYLAEFAAASSLRSVADLIAYNKAHPETLALFGQEWFEASAAKGPLTSPAYRAAFAHGRRHARGLGIDAMLRRHRLDAIVAPTGAPAWLIDPVNGDAWLPSATTPAAVAGYPHVTVPMGDVHGLPVGLSFFSTAWQEPRLLAFAQHYEQLTRHRAPPGYRPTST